MHTREEDTWRRLDREQQKGERAALGKTHADTARQTEHSCARALPKRAVGCGSGPDGRPGRLARDWLLIRNQPLSGPVRSLIPRHLARQVHDPCRRQDDGSLKLSQVTSQPSAARYLRKSPISARIENNRRDAYAADASPQIIIPRTLPVNTAEMFFQRFFTRRNLGGPTGQPLYRYRVRSSEFQELRDLLRRQLSERVFDRGRVEPAMAMAFCLWAAEWWRREYEEGPWSWWPLLADLGRVDLAPGEPHYFKLQDVVARGLEAWGRQVLRVGSSRAFLATLACEGGLPMKIIVRGQTHLRSYLKGVLEEYRLFGSAGIPLAELAERVRDRLPKTWRQDVVYQLSGELIAEVWKLQRELGDTEKPVVDLDRIRPDWRDELPLRVTDDVARTLLNGLLLDAAEVARGGRIRVRWTVQLMPDGEDLWELRGCFDLPTTIAAEAFRRLFAGNHDTELPQRFDLGVQTRRRPFVPLALATLMQATDRGRFFGLERLSAADRVQTAGVTHARALVARTPESALRSDSFPGATGMSDLPWVFAPTDLSVAADRASQTYRLVGQGSLKRREAWVLVAVSDETVAELEENGEARAVGSIRNETGRCVYHVSGQVTFVSPDGSRTVIATGAASDSDSAEYRLEGREQLFGRGASSAFLGRVSLSETSDGEFPTDRPGKRPMVEARRSQRELASVFVRGCGDGLDHWIGTASIHQERSGKTLRTRLYPASERRYQIPLLDRPGTRGDCARRLRTHRGDGPFDRRPHRHDTVPGRSLSP